MEFQPIKIKKGGHPTPNINKKYLNQTLIHNSHKQRLLYLNKKAFK